MDVDQNFVTLLLETASMRGQAAQGGQFEFLNFSVPGYDLTQTMDVALNDVPQFQPDVYVLVLTELSVYRPWDTHLIYFAQSGADAKYDFLRQVMREAGAKQSDIKVKLSGKFAPYRMSVIRQSIQAIKDDAEKHNAQFIVVLAPAVETADLAKRRFDGIPELLSSMNVTDVDASEAFNGMLDRKSLRENGVDIHPNALGHKMICESLYAKLRVNPDAWSKLVGPALKVAPRP